MAAHRISKDDLLRVLEIVAEGEHLLEACARCGFPYHSVWRRLAADEELWGLYRKACEAFGDARAAKVSAEIREAGMDPKRASVIAGWEKWVISSKARQQFGDTKRVEHTGSGGGPIELQGRNERELVEMLQRQLSVLGVTDMAGLAAVIGRKQLPQTIEGEVVQTERAAG